MNVGDVGLVEGCEGETLLAEVVEGGPYMDDGKQNTSLGMDARASGRLEPFPEKWIGEVP